MEFLRVIFAIAGVIIVGMATVLIVPHYVQSGMWNILMFVLVLAGASILATYIVHR